MFTSSLDTLMAVSHNTSLSPAPDPNQIGIIIGARAGGQLGGGWLRGNLARSCSCGTITASDKTRRSKHVARRGGVEIHRTVRQKWPTVCAQNKTTNVKQLLLHVP